jgi:hypothetical protein
MYAEMVIAGTPGSVLPIVPRAAVQNVGRRTVVYLAHPAESDRFIERDVRLGPASGDTIEVVSGLQAGDRVVTSGSFYVRAERERLGLRPGPAVVSPPARQSGAAGAAAGTAAQAARILVNAQSFDPARISLRAGVPARLTFVRTTDATCATDIVVPSLGIKRPLPLNEPVTIAFTPANAGEVAFACGMDMLKGVVVVE